MVWPTLRTGFPDSLVELWFQPMDMICRAEIVKAAMAAGVYSFRDLPKEHTHGEWINFITEHARSPFWICDTDVAFWSKVEGGSGALCGRLIPEFRDPVTGMLTARRLHPSLLRINPQMVRYRTPETTSFNPVPNLWQAASIPTADGWVFHDTASLAYNAFGGDAFTNKQLDAFDHLFLSTYEDIALPKLNDQAMVDVREAIWANPELLKGAWRHQDEWFKRMAA